MPTRGQDAIVRSETLSLSNPEKWQRSFGRRISKCSGRSFRWQRELKGGTSSRVGGRPQAAAMGFDNGAADGQPHAGALRLGGKERRENLLGIPNGKPNARIAHCYQQLVLVGPSRCDGEFASRIFHRLDAI